MQSWIIVLIVIGAVICLCFALSIVSYRAAFGTRYDKNPLLKYFSAKHFELTAEEISTGKLRGCAYTFGAVENNGKVLVFVHGMGPGQC